MKQMKTIPLTLVSDLHKAILEGKLGPKPDTLTVTGASYIYQTTQFPSSKTKYHNYYLLMRVESYFGACSHAPDQLDMEAAEQLSGLTVGTVLRDKRLPVQIAAMDGYLGVVHSHQSFCDKVVNLSAGTPIERAKLRDALIADAANIKASQKVALIGVVNPLVEAIKQRGGVCLPCDLSLTETQWGEAIERDMEKVLDQADNVICTAMTLSNGTFDRILTRVRQKQVPLTVYAQTGSAVIAQFMNNGVSALVAEPFPFSQFSASVSEVYCYTRRKGNEDVN
ncbi:Rossmann-like domain-containing protein [Evansella sp. AB-rgal1]|uniref:Rossmann-like domain-containing protein n=1 Tax=Evansella sp. AB-rgal1 TaxID=3242696 RepID=UPI00359E9AA2